MQKHNNQKPGTPCFVPSKTIITTWLKSIFSDLPLNTKIQDFGDGVIYCRLLNHFYNNPPHSKITWSPKNQYEYANNLKHVQTALLQLGITIPFDVNRVAKRKFLQNWALINSFYKHFSSGEQHHPQGSEENSLSSNLASFYSNTVSNHPPISQNPTVHPPGYFLGPPQQALILKRTQPIINSYNQIEQMNPIRPTMPVMNNLNSIPQTHIWNQHNLASLAQNTLQITSYLKQNTNIYNSSPNKGKWSVGSQMFQSNYHAVIDRVKQILLKASHDTQKVKQIKMLLGMPIDEEQVIKIQDDVGFGHVVYNQKVEKIQKFQKLEVKQDPKIQNKQKQFKQFKQLNQIIQKQCSNSKQPKISLTKILKKPFKI